MIIDGNKIAEHMYADMSERVFRMSRAPRLVIIVCAPNFETTRYLALKKLRAERVGILTTVVELPETSTTEEVVLAITSHSDVADGLIVQLPLPAHIDTDAVLRAIPTELDADALNPETTKVLSPVVSACKKILETFSVHPQGMNVTIIGKGRLVGLPTQQWFTSEGAHVTTVTKETEHLTNHTMQADIIVCGAGNPGLILPEMVKENVIILDAGTSEESGKLRGDADESCAEKALIFTPVPGGIGPLTIAFLLQNVVSLTTR